jgi:hypothetical protein
MAWSEEDEAAEEEAVVVAVVDVAVDVAVADDVWPAVVVATEEGTITMKALWGTPGGGGGVLIVRVTANVWGEPEALESAMVAVAL